MRREETRTGARTGLISLPMASLLGPARRYHRPVRCRLSAGPHRTGLARPQWPAPLAALQHWRALALLGEPGIGKSTTLKEEADRIATLPADADLVSIYVDLRAFSSERASLPAGFRKREFIAWKNGSSHLFLHLDSLDEALLRIDSIANLLASELPAHPDGPHVDPHRLPDRRVAGRYAGSRADQHLGRGLGNVRTRAAPSAGRFHGPRRPWHRCRRLHAARCSRLKRFPLPSSR